MIAALLEKDVKLFFRNQFIAVITALGLVMYAAIYLLLPNEVDQTLSLALYVEEGALTSVSEAFGDVVEAELYDSQDALIAAVDDGNYSVGVAVTADAIEAVANDEQGTIQVYYAPGTTESVRNTYNDLLTLMFGRNLPYTVNTSTEIVGPDFLEEPTPMRDRLLPLLVMAIFFIEMMGLAGLLVEEIENGTARGVLITPLTTGQFFMAKALLGVGLAFVQGLLLLIVTGGLFKAPVIIIITLFINGLFISGIAFLVASVAQDYMTAMGWNILFVFALLIPAITVVAPGLTTDFVTIIPSFFFVDTLHRAMNLQATLSDVTPNLIALLLVSVVLLGLGSTLLRRRLA